MSRATLSEPVRDFHDLRTFPRGTTGTIIKEGAILGPLAGTHVAFQPDGHKLDGEYCLVYAKIGQVHCPARRWFRQ